MTESIHELLGAYLLGGLADDEHRRFAEHLRACSQCQADLGQLSAIPRLLGPADDTAPAAVSGVPSEVLLARLHSHRRRERLLWSAASGVVAVLLAVTGFFAGQRFPPVPDGARLTAGPAPGETARFEIVLVAKGWGTQIDVRGGQLPSTGTMTLWVTDAAGDRWQVATWRATTSGQAALVGACPARPSEVRTIEIRMTDGRLLATTE